MSLSHLQIEKNTKTIYFDEIAIFPTCRLYIKIKWLSYLAIGSTTFLSLDR